ncbi:hypothetical protein BH09PSE2_BH09PSE2_06130 [soil metagenome]
MRFSPVLATLSLLLSGASYSVASAADQRTVAASPTGASLVTVENAARLKGLNRVAIGSFTVDILDRLESSADIGGIELVTGAPSQLVVTLVGCDRERYQSLVDAAYDRFVADLTTKGFTVIPQSELQADPEFRKLISAEAAAARDERSPAGSNRYLSTASLPIYLVDETTLFPKMEFHIMGPKPERDPYIGWGSSLGSGFAALGFQRQHAAAKSIGAPILNVRITLLGGQAQINRDFWKTAGSARTDAAMRFVALYNRVLVVGPDQGMARVALSEDLATDKLGDLVSTTSGGSRALQAAGNTAIVASRMMGAFVPGGSLIGAMHYTNKNTYEVRTDQATFENALNGGFVRVSDILTSALSESR